MYVDFTSKIRSSRTALTVSHPARPTIVAFFIFFPHHDAKTTSGSRRATSAGSTMRSHARPAPASSGKIGAPPAISTSSSTHRMPEISGSSHSSKKTRSRRGTPPPRRGCDQIRLSRRRAAPPHPAANEAPEHPDHLEDLRDAALVERHDRDAALHEPAEIGLQIGKGEHQVRPQRFDLVEPRVDECRDFRLLARLGRAHRVAGDADDPIALAEQVQRLRRLLGEAHNPRRIQAHAALI
jgi:hypothetical protein